MDPLAHRTMIAQVQVERQRLLPEHEEATQTTIDMLRTSTGRDDPASVPYLNLAYLLGVKNTYIIDHYETDIIADRESPT
ncbi:hypothetical protein ACFVW5_21290 [Streptomyces sp. NPDC058232]|uniref:hypothetical protein n=1 Tax=Streptomyces sp. NPDC058232 TaxID=3346393 RepID=UPI0036EF637F